MTVYTSLIVVETPNGEQSLVGPCDEDATSDEVEVGSATAGWNIWASTHRSRFLDKEDRSYLFIDKIEKIMHRGFYQYELGKYGRVLYVEIFVNGTPADL